MIEKKIDNGFEPGVSICPYLGMKDDPATIMDYPSEWNYCHRSKPSAVPVLEHQRMYCLLLSHDKCPVFLNEVVTSLPDDVRLLIRKRRRNKKRNWIAAILVMGILLAVGIFFRSQFLAPRDLFPVLQPKSDAVSPMPTGFIIINPNINSTSLIDAASSTQKTETSTPQPSITPFKGTESPVSTIHSLDTPIGIAHRFVIHRIQQGESLGGLAVQYNTTVEAITKVNFYMPDPVWVNWLVIIPVDNNDVAGLPSFDAYMVVDGGVSIEDLASRLDLDATSLMFYNGLEAEYPVSGGEWLLIPHTGE